MYWVFFAGRGRGNRPNPHGCWWWMDVMVVNAFMVVQKKRGSLVKALPSGVQWLLPRASWNVSDGDCSSFSQVSAKGLTMVNPSIKVFNGGVYTAVGCIEHGEFAFEISTGCKHGKQDFWLLNNDTNIMNNYHIYKQIQKLADIGGRWRTMGLKDVVSLYTKGRKRRLIGRKTTFSSL